MSGGVAVRLNPLVENKMRKLEQAEQTAFIRWCQASTWKYPELAALYHVPNGGSRNKIEAANLKRSGVKAGIPDLHLPVARHGYHSIYIEMKSQKGTLSDSQANMIALLESYGNYCAVCYSWEEAKKEIEWYLNGK